MYANSVVTLCYVLYIEASVSGGVRALGHDSGFPGCLVGDAKASVCAKALPRSYA